MVIHSVNEMGSLINDQINTHEEIQEYLLKAEAVAQVALSDDFLDYNKHIISTYLWALCDIINHLKNLHERALNELLKNRASISIG